LVYLLEYYDILLFNERYIKIYKILKIDI
jgi:hypothetical protein